MFKKYPNTFTDTNTKIKWNTNSSISFHFDTNTGIEFNTKTDTNTRGISEDSYKLVMET